MTFITNAAAAEAFDITRKVLLRLAEKKFRKRIKFVLKGQCHEMVVEFRPWIASIGKD
jgi:hypothetical protein